MANLKKTANDFVRKTIDFHKQNDRDILAFLAREEINATGFIRQAIRFFIKNGWQGYAKWLVVGDGADIPVGERVLFYDGSLVFIGFLQNGFVINDKGEQCNLNDMILWQHLPST